MPMEAATAPPETPLSRSGAGCEVVKSSPASTELAIVARNWKPSLHKRLAEVFWLRKHHPDWRQLPLKEQNTLVKQAMYLSFEQLLADLATE